VQELPVSREKKQRKDSFSSVQALRAWAKQPAGIPAHTVYGSRNYQFPRSFRVRVSLEKLHLKHLQYSNNLFLVKLALIEI
jgi:hypothetical protein